jgi:CSLREA domain-containing protein
MNRVPVSLMISLALASLAAIPLPARGDVFNITKTADTADGACDRDCSLREAVVAANAAAGADVVLLPSGNYLLVLGEVALTDDLTVLGAGAASSLIDAGSLSRGFRVGASVRAELRDLRVHRGAGANGGGILNEGILTVTRCAITNSLASDQGGGIASSGTLTVTASLLRSNQAKRGGGVSANGGAATLTNVTLTFNQATDFGGGLYAFADTAVTVNNATLTGNSAGIQGGGTYVEGSPFIGREGARFSNSILAGNFGTADADCAGSPLSGGYNLVGQLTGCTGFSAAQHDLLGSAATPLDAKLGTFGDQGGATFLYPLLAGSPALNAGNPAAPGTVADSCATTDQRGAGRPGTPAPLRCDIGAFEQTSQCTAGGSTLCLNQNRFRVNAAWRTAQNATGAGQGVTLTPETGYFWFFDPGNVELTVKVIDACALGNRFWVFAAGLTNVKVDLTVVDTQTGQSKVYSNPLNRTFVSILDTNAFPCP